MAHDARGAGRGTALITGASSGIGRDLAMVFAEHGYDLILLARGEARLNEVGADLERRHGIRFAALAEDLADPEAPARIASWLSVQGQRPDILVNNAGFGVHGPFAETDAGQELRMIQVNVAALVHLTKLVLPGMIERRAGRILNVASTAAFQPGPFMAVYYATKAFVLSFSEALASELLGSGVTVTALCPGPTRTAFQANARMGPTRLSASGLVMESEPVARAGFEGAMKGKTIVIPGVKNRLLAETVRFLPRRAVTRFVRRVQAPAHP